MHVGEIKFTDCANGPGVRISMFVSGCTNCCEGCFNTETWDFNYGEEYTEEMEEDILQELSLDYYAGITILGGEPFEPQNQRVLVGLIRKIRERLPKKDIWMYTGFTYDKDLIEGGRKHTEVTDEILSSISTLVDGKFILSKRNLMLNFRGSENQRIIDMEKTLDTGSVVLSPLND